MGDGLGIKLNVHGMADIAGNDNIKQGIKAYLNPCPSCTPELCSEQEVYKHPCEGWANTFQCLSCSR